MTENSQHDFFANDDAVRDGCGVFGIFAPNHDIARITYFGLFALQHRGQESAGIAVTNGKEMTVYKDMGLVSRVFNEDTLAGLNGFAAIGHTRYSTTGSSQLCNAQPMTAESSIGTIAVSHNGNLTNASVLREELDSLGISFDTTTDSEIIVKLVAHEIDKNNGDVVEAIKVATKRMEGAYAVAIMTNEGVYGFRDRWGIRPLSLGRLNGHYHVIASETTAFDVIGAVFIQDISAGELVVITDENAPKFHLLTDDPKPSMCIFEFIYVARPDSQIYGKSVHLARRRMGQELAREHPIDADVVISVPDTGTPAAIGYAEASKIPYGEGLIKSRYIHRTFIQPDQRLRELGVRMKLNPLRETLSGKRVIIVEDSIVRGTTTKSIVKVIREAGATEVHLRISSPPYSWPCFYGIDTCERSHLISARLKDNIEEVRKEIGADTLGYLSIEGMIRSISLPKNIFCMACLNGKYPIDIPRELKVSKFALEDMAEVDQLELYPAAADNYDIEV